MGNGGHGMEEYSESTGKYIADGQPNKRYDNPEEEVDTVNRLFGFGRNDVFRSENFLPKTTSESSRRDVWSPVGKSYEERADYMKQADREDEKIYGKDFIARVYDKRPETIDDKSEERQSLRKQWVGDEISLQKSERQIQYGHHAVIVLGLPGSGKSAVAKDIIENNGAFEIDSDIFKTDYIPEFIQDNTMTVKTQKEAGLLADTMRNDVCREGANICIGKVGGTPSAIAHIVSELKNYGYTIDVVYNDVPAKETEQRNDSRFQRNLRDGKPARYVPRRVIRGSEYGILKTVNSLSRNPDVNGVAMYSNDVRYGEKPKLLHTVGKIKEII